MNYFNELFINRSEGSSDVDNAETKILQDASSSDILWKPGTIILDRYHVSGVLGQGGMGTVYLVECPVSYGCLYFAVKTMLASSLKNQTREHAFLRELQTWIDLPKHPHLNQCFFFRTIDEKLSVFAEYIKGGSLKEWIQKKKLASIQHVLDIAIQCAWGLDAAHQCGVVHQDVKPANILVSEEGIAKLTDFGLARARQMGGVDELSERSSYDASFTISARGMTLAYCSPEQVKGDRINSQTDIWSLGLSILEMCTGRLAWNYGIMALRILEKYNNDSSNRFGIPESLAVILEKCFQEDRASRWRNMKELSFALIRLYESIAQTPYLRQEPPSYIMKNRAEPGFNRRFRGKTWDNPNSWIVSIRERWKECPVSDMNLPQVISRKAQALVDLEVYQRIQKYLEEMAVNSSNRCIDDLLQLLLQKIQIHRVLDDYPGAFGVFEKIRQVIDTETYLKEHEILAYRVEMYTGLASIYSDCKKYYEAVDQLDRAIHTLSMITTVFSRPSNEILAVIYGSKALAVAALGTPIEALALCDQAVQILSDIDPESAADEQLNDIARIYNSKAMILYILGRPSEAVDFYDNAILLWSKLVQERCRHEFRDDLARGMNNKAVALYTMNEHLSSILLSDQAIAIREELIFKEGNSEHREDLAKVYNNKANALRAYGELKEAASFYNKSIEIREQLVYQEGRMELAFELARTMNNRANSLREMNDLKSAAHEYQRAMEMISKLIHNDNRNELTGSLARIKINRAAVLLALDHIDMAETEARQAKDILAMEFQRTKEAELKTALTNVRQLLNSIRMRRKNA
ncbi:serine/threonine protein kinase [bacterium]|nr:serine/threonine protein kinase [candidate division CSSED10-310 bacterium]